MRLKYVLAVDIGGTKTATAVISSKGEIIQMSKALTELSGPAALIDQITAMLLEDLRQAEVKIRDVLGLGVGIPAVIDTERKAIIWAPNLPGWKNIPLQEELSTRLNLPVYIEYDGHAAVLGEWWWGAGRGYQNLVSIIIGTGIGGGMVLDGKLYRGASGLAGAAGWFVLGTRRETNEYAQQFGHWESLAAGPGIARLAAEKLRHGSMPSLLRKQISCSDKELNAKMIFEAAGKGDDLALEVIRQISEILGVGIANIISLLNPEVVIIGGGVGMQAGLFIDQIREVVLHNAQPISALAVQIVPSQLGECAGLLGVATSVLKLGITAV